jgi:hypothetical protein
VIIAEPAHGFQSHVGPRYGSLVVLLAQDCTNEADDGVVVGEDARDIGSALDLAIEPLERIGRADLGPMAWNDVQAAPPRELPR